MARERIKLTVQKHGRGIRYRKQYKGKLFVSTVFDQDSKRNRSDAWKEFVDWRSHRNHELELEQIKGDWDKRAWAIVTDKIRTTMHELESKDTPLNRRDWNYWFESLHKVETAVQQGIRYFHDVEPTDYFEGKHVSEWNESDWQREVPIWVPEPEEAPPKQPPWKRHKTVDPDFTSRAVVDRYLSTLKSQAQSKQRSTSLYGQTRAALNHFVDWFGNNRGMDTLCEDDVITYHDHLSSMIGEKSQNTIASYFKLWRTFIENVADDNPEVHRPTNLRNKRFTIKPGASKIETFTIDEFKTVLELASPRMELFLLLMMNTGMTQIDISDLLSDEVDWKNGRIIRARSKEANAPTINWKLWSRTFELLQEQGNQSGLVLTKQDGHPLVTSGIKPDGKEWKRDAVVSSYRHLVQKAKNHEKVDQQWNKSLKQLRKTGATLIEGSSHAEFVDMFLDHSRVARKHYLKGQIVPKFDDAIVWLGEQFDL